MVLGSLFMHRDSVARKAWRGDAHEDPHRELQGFPFRTAMLIPPPVACTTWWISYHFKVDVPTPQGWGRIGATEGPESGYMAIAGWLVFVLAMWYDGWLFRRGRARTAGTAAEAGAAAAAGPEKAGGQTKSISVKPANITGLANKKKKKKV